MWSSIRTQGVLMAVVITSLALAGVAGGCTPTGGGGGGGDASANENAAANDNAAAEPALEQILQNPANNLDGDGDRSWRPTCLPKGTR